jgi:hypothetical protein
MKFECKEISIVDEEFGCTVSFRENKDSYDYENEQSINQILSSIGQYILLQRTYPEDEFEKDYYYFESSESDKSGKLIDFTIDLCRTQFVMALNKELYEIQLNIDDPTFEKLKTVLTIITNGREQLNFLD